MNDIKKIRQPMKNQRIMKDPDEKWRFMKKVEYCNLREPSPSREEREAERSKYVEFFEDFTKDNTKYDKFLQRVNIHNAKKFTNITNGKKYSFPIDFLIREQQAIEKPAPKKDTQEAKKNLEAINKLLQGYVGKQANLIRSYK